MEKRVYRCYPIACLLFWLVSFPPLVTCHRYLNNRVARAGYALYLRLLISSALPRNIHVRSMTLIASWHTSPKWLSPVGSKSCTGSLLNHTNVNGKWIYQRSFYLQPISDTYTRSSFPNLLIRRSSQKKSTGPFAAYTFKESVQGLLVKWASQHETVLKLLTRAVIS